MKYYGVKKVESVSKENTSLVVNKNKKKKEKGSFIDVFLVQMCVCLMLICVLSVTKLLINPTENVFLKKNSLEISNMNVVSEITSSGGTVAVKYKEDKFISLFAGTVENVTDKEMIVKVNDDVKIKYIGFASLSCKKGDSLVSGQQIGQLKEKSVSFNIIHKNSEASSIRINNNKLEW